MSVRRVVLGALFAIGGCGETEVVPVSIAAEPTVVSIAAPNALPEVAPIAIPPPPAPDREALERAREEAARAAFERAYPLHGVAYHYLGQVHQRADARSPVIGYLRRGAQFRAQASVRGPGCGRGWHRVPGGGYVCRGEGFALGSSPQSFDPSPRAPALDEALPYPYAWVTRDHTPQYWRIPSRAEEAEVTAWIRRQAAQEERVPPPPIDAPPDAPEPGLEAPPGLETEGAPEENTEANSEENAEETAGGEAPAILRMRMRRGFYVSVDGVETNDGRRFYRTVRGAYVPADVLAEARPPSTRGVVLGGRWQLPLGFVYRGGVRTLVRDPARGALTLGDPIDRGTPLPLSEETIERRGQRYLVSDRGRIVREDALRVAGVRPRPSSIPAGARWIHVDLARQVLVAYDGDRPVFATLVSTGREGFATPAGTFRIQSKHVSTTMDDPDAAAEAYSIEDVPWTMYFSESYALHAAFWHDGFGRERSHGCVNLAPADARWVFQWTLPTLPSGWHGISSERAGGTFVVIE